MCILALPVRSVSNTRIFTSEHQGRQLVVYEMSVKMRTSGNAMILPVPTVRKGDIHLVNLEAVPDFLERMPLLFQGMTLGLTKSRGLSVEKVGSYLVSVAGNLEELDLVNPEVFTLGPRVKEILSRHYAKGFCFVVAQLSHSGKYHPLAYTHPLAPEGHLFVPTMHEHGDDHEKPRWDHQIYTLGGHGLLTSPGRVLFKSSKNRLRAGQVSNYLARVGEKVPDLKGYLDTREDCVLYAFEVKGQQRNMDMLLRGSTMEVSQ